MIFEDEIAASVVPMNAEERMKFLLKAKERETLLVANLIHRLAASEIALTEYHDVTDQHKRQVYEGD